MDAAEARHLILGHADALVAIEEAVDAFERLTGRQADVHAFVVDVAVSTRGKLARLRTDVVRIGIVDRSREEIVYGFGVLSIRRVDGRLTAENTRVDIGIALSLIAGAFVAEEKRILRAHLLGRGRRAVDSARALNATYKFVGFGRDSHAKETLTWPIALLRLLIPPEIVGCVGCTWTTEISSGATDTAMKDIAVATAEKDTVGLTDAAHSGVNGQRA